MNEYEIALAIGALGTAIISRSLPRAWLWIAAGVLSFAASSAYWKFGLPYHAAFTLGCDAAVCLSVYAAAKEEWELRIYDVFRLSVLISLLRMFEIIETNTLYAVSLELLNWLALLLVGGTGLLARMAGGNSPFDPWLARLRSLKLALRSSRSAAPWFKVAR